eukprot:TRINITY_DN1957_c0_g2_i3.p1 TRINITY_DN1957_c0_g2~~TRINITY_DN1957_c0_g2_i3.p1  ORF type:complete len:385 (-),score=75.60 TRINITY_DN1957_c0_g2_i3:465-1619(-)
MPFSEDLWDGFEKVITKIVLNIQTCKDYADWFNKRAKIEKYYADYLNDLCKVHPGGRNASIDKQEKTLREAMLSVTEAGTRMGAKHLAAFNEILAQIVKPLETQIKHFEQEKKRLENDGKAKIKTQTDAVVSASKAHDAYVKACKDFEYNRDYHNKTEAELTAAPEAKRARIQGYLAKAVTKMQQSQDKAVAAENAYKVAVQAVDPHGQKRHCNKAYEAHSGFTRPVHTASASIAGGSSESMCTSSRYAVTFSGKRMDAVCSSAILWFESASGAESNNNKKEMVRTGIEPVTLALLARCATPEHEQSVSPRLRLWKVVNSCCHRSNKEHRAHSHTRNARGVCFAPTTGSVAYDVPVTCSKPQIKLANNQPMGGKKLFIEYCTAS